jgi:hypothetical protein
MVVSVPENAATEVEAMLPSPWMTTAFGVALAQTPKAFDLDSRLGALDHVVLSALALGV